MRPASARSTNGPLLVHGPWSGRYDFGPGHPLTARRFRPGIELLRAVAGDAPDLLEPTPASDETLQWVHEASYVQIVKRLSHAPFGPSEAGIGPGDTPAFPGMHQAAAAVAGGSLAAIEAIIRGEVGHAFHPGGGLHHAMPDRAAGFCVYDDAALAIARARRNGLRVLYVDLDVHHGDGVQLIHADDPGVMTVSIHQSGRTNFPGTGSVDELGQGEAAGTVVNLPMDPDTGEHAWIAALERVLPELAAAFGPDVVVSQHGADAHAWDPLANLRVTTTAMGAAARLVDSIAHRWAGGRWLATGGGGYDVYRVVPRTWSLVWLAALHRDGNVAIPETWRTHWAAEARRMGQTPLPTRLEDDENAGLPHLPSEEQSERAAALTASLVRSLTVPALLRAATDRGWWRSLAPSGGGGAADPAGPVVETLASVDPATWAGLKLAAGTLPLLDPAAGHDLVAGALASRDSVQVSASVSRGVVVGAILSAADATGRSGARVLLTVGVAPSRRGQGLASALLWAHLESAPSGASWVAEVTLAERDPVAPTHRVARAALARRLLVKAGFRVTPSDEAVGAADPEAIVARRP